MKHLPLAAAAAVLVTAGSLLAAAPSAVAAPSSSAGHSFPPQHGAHKATGSATAATYNGACGSGYTVIDQLSLGTAGTVYLTYNSSTGKNCVVTVRTTPGTAIFMAAGIRLTGNPASEVDDTGNYTTYAGPVYLYAKGHCIDWAGQIGSVYNEQDNSHCG
jgi:hypothetical protein